LIIAVRFETEQTYENYSGLSARLLCSKQVLEAASPQDTGQDSVATNKRNITNERT
jgi:hypothetical protein